jgi:hypothetical protein
LRFRDVVREYVAARLVSSNMKKARNLENKPRPGELWRTARVREAVDKDNNVWGGRIGAILGGQFL